MCAELVFRAEFALYDRTNSGPEIISSVILDLRKIFAYKLAKFVVLAALGEDSFTKGLNVGAFYQRAFNLLFSDRFKCFGNLKPMVIRLLNTARLCLL